jgi:hypothetical protein
MTSLADTWQDPAYYRELVRVKFPRHIDRVRTYTYGYRMRHPESKVPYYVLIAYYWCVEIRTELAEGWREWG